MTLNDLPEPVKREIINQTLKDKTMPDNRFGVTELIGCLRKSWYRRKQPLPVPLEGAWYFYRGNLFDNEWTNLFERNQGRSTMRIPEPAIVVSGKFDFEFEDAICDLKTTNTLDYVRRDGPKTEHIYQVLFYCWNEAKTEGRLYYVSFGDAERLDILIDEKATGRSMKGNTTVVGTDYQKEVVRFITANAIKLHGCLVFNVKPQRLYGIPEYSGKADYNYWMCRYCEYRAECYGDE